MIRLESIQRRYASDEVETTALADINLEVAEGEFLAVMGPSGCGKSTLLNILGTVDRPSSGRYLFGDHGDLAVMNEAALAQMRGQTLGFVFQSFNLIDELTIQENVALGLAYRKGSQGDKKQRIEQAMDRVGISHRARHYPHQLSGGQQQRAAIARAIVGDPSLILADEPTGNLDTENGQQVMDILTSLNGEGATIIMVTHSPSHADMAKRRIDMLDGRVVSSVARAI
ncbi:ABC transporter ATP-binding protein [Sphingomonas oryzagri]|uniref:ABC transporter ATP-binding protein n=1 Tax=Sphingomonas oryzagri TaxID=3042314 RepID=A0ABT6MWY8_9SPHN|nr:ABC transporter ATP-binding protein [Sphingomonas oryzagri]MDH7637554.1 ABC transporter ATP-binding protein [Sphingomonas oryzagri]